MSDSDEARDIAKFILKTFDKEKKGEIEES